MRILLLALALLPAAASARDKDAVRPMPLGRLGAECRNAETQHARAAQNPVRPGKLGEQPAADQYLAVLRLEGGCDKPVKIRQGIGGGIEDQR